MTGTRHFISYAKMKTELYTSQRWVFKDCFRRHSDLCRREKPVSRDEVGIETGFHAGVGRNAN